MYEINNIVYEYIVEKINKYHPRAHFTIVYNSSLSLHSFGNEEKLVALQVYS